MKFVCYEFVSRVTGVGQFGPICPRGKNLESHGSDFLEKIIYSTRSNLVIKTGTIVIIAIDSDLVVCALSSQNEPISKEQIIISSSETTHFYGRISMLPVKCDQQP
jgi:hypothetical protein